MGALVRSDSRQPAVKQEAAVKGRQYLTFTVGGESFGIAIASIIPSETIDHRGHLRTYPHIHGLEAFFGAVFERRSG